MKTLISTLCLLLVFVLSASADPPKPIAEHPFFKHVIGKWTAEGTLTNAEGNAIKYSAEWTGKATDNDTFSVEGTRQIDQTTQSYSWTFIQDASTGLLEVSHVVQNETGNPQRFEVSFIEASLTLELSTFLNSGNSKVTIKETLEGTAHDKLLTDVQFVDDNGVTTLSGIITNSKSPEL